MEPLFEKEPEILILGSMPGKRSIEVNEYYSDSRNQFWKILSYVFDEDTDKLLDYDCKKKFLFRHKVAVWDVIKHADREGSLDKNIKRNAIMIC